MAATTQKFIEIQDIVDDVVILSGKNACLVIEVTATNFSLMSKEEQDAKIISYSSLLNSLSFPIQIVIRSEKLDIGKYLKLLEGKEAETQNTNLAERIREYRGFVSELVKVNTVLDKKFYICIPYSFLERPRNLADRDFMESAKTALRSKAESLHSQLKRFNIQAKTLNHAELVKLFYDTFNQGEEVLTNVS